MQKTYFIKTFGCAQNVADSERIANAYESKGMKKASSIESAHHVVINTCMIREKAETRVYGLVHNLSLVRKREGLPEKIVVTGCMVGMALRDSSGKFLKLIRQRMPAVDEFLPIEEVGFDHAPLRTEITHAWVPISNGCNNFCTFCVVPFTRGREISRPYTDVIGECEQLAKTGYKKITLLGMNVNSYGADLVSGLGNIHVLRDLEKTYFPKSSESKKTGFVLPSGKKIEPVFVKHLNRLRIPTLFPYLLEDIAHVRGIELIDFLSSNPWDFSDKLIDVISRNPNITRSIHLPVQSGSNSVLKRMNRWYTKEIYFSLIERIRTKIPHVRFSTDIIVGFCGETEEEFEDTCKLVQKVGFYKAYISLYSDRPQTAAHKVFHDDVVHKEKKRRWLILEKMINSPRQKGSVH
ncbi:radical SAM protein [Candidatus Gottesmanbacteria bacterium]|nr:radical SAM protein [Candidatus Gottesmanbacteria bacterium]